MMPVEQEAISPGPGDTPRISIILPAKNEGSALRCLLPRLCEAQPGAEIIIADDASSDDTAMVVQLNGAQRIVHPYSMGNGAAIKSGARAANGEVLVFLDADGQHDPRDIPRILAKLEEGYEMVVGARSSQSQANLGRSIANRIYNIAASWMVGHQVQDLTSGFRAVRAKPFRKFLHLLPNGFSYPTTITMAFFRAGHPVAYLPIHAGRRQGKSHIKPLQDSLRFLLIIFKVGTLYSPLKLFFPASMLFFVTGLSYYLYTYHTVSRFTNMSALLFIVSIVVFLIGLVSEQITNLLYRDTEI